MTNKELIKLTGGVLPENWSTYGKKDFVQPPVTAVFDDEELIDYFKKWEAAVLTHDEIIEMSKEYIPINAFFANSSGIYFLVDGTEIVYIGKSTALGGRLSIHCKDDSKEFDKIAILWLDPELLNDFEWPYIAKFMPKYNFKKKGPSIVSKMHEIIYKKGLKLSELILNRK